MINRTSTLHQLDMNASAEHVKLLLYADCFTRNKKSITTATAQFQSQTLVTDTHKEHRPTHTHARTDAQRGIALTLAHTDPLAQPQLLRNQRSQGEWLWSLPASVKLPLGNLRAASPMSGLYPCMHTSKEKVGITDYSSPFSLQFRQHICLYVHSLMDAFSSSVWLCTKLHGQNKRIKKTG